MQHLLITIAAVLLVGCGSRAPDISIHEAAQSGNIEAIVQHIAAGTDVNSPGENKGKGYIETPTDYARLGMYGWGQTPAPKNLSKDHSHHKAKEIVELLKQHGGHSGSIHVAVESGDLNGVKNLLNGNMNLNKTSLGGKSPLHLAAEKGYKEITSLLLDNGVQIDFENWSSKTALHFAVEKGHIEIVDLLLINGANVNAINKGFPSGTSLDLASRLKRKKIVNLLRKNGGLTAKELKPKKNNQKNIEALKKFSEIDELLRNRTSKPKADFETVKRYLSSGADVNLRNQFGGSLLHIASAQGDKPLVRLLISEGAQLNVKNNRAMTPLDLSIKFKRTETINILRKHGAKKNKEIKTEEKSTKPITSRSVLPSDSPSKVKPVVKNEKLEQSIPKTRSISIQHASRKGDIEIVRQQIASGADVNVKTRDGQTPLHWAASFNHAGVAELLIANMADVNAKNKFGSTPLHYAASKGHKEIITLLIMAGANVNGKMNNGITPLSSASFIHERTPNSKKTKNDIIDLLRKHGGKTTEELKVKGK